MAQKPLDLPPDVARRFVEAMHGYFAEKNGIKRDEIARMAGVTRIRLIGRQSCSLTELRETSVLFC